MTYQVIYADPPWRYSFSRSKSRQIENQYPTMTVAEICALRIPRADDAVLFLWATAPKLLDALAVMEAWGFRYVTQAVWDKEIMGMGYWFRGQHEILLVGTRGHWSPPPVHARISSVWKEQRGRHSRKPDGLRKMIADAWPDARRVELFARQVTPGWDIWGNDLQVARDSIQTIN